MAGRRGFGKNMILGEATGRGSGKRPPCEWTEAKAQVAVIFSGRFVI
jgi:hypothetical protein